MTQDPQPGQAILNFVAGYFPATAHYPVLVGAAVLLLVAGISLGLLPLARRYVVATVHRFFRLSHSPWGEKLVASGFFQRVTWIVPLLVFHQGLQLIPSLPPQATGFFGRLALAILTLVVVRTFAALLKATNAIYTSYPMARHRPINSYLQILNIIAHLFAAVVMVAVLLGQSPWLFLSGLGAAMAIILLVFRDTLLSLVAGIQLTTNNLIQIGDWIEMPQFGADGDVVDISLHAIRVRNGDNTITVIPTHKFLDNAFKNWRGMSESGARRIKRAFNVDMSTVRFLSPEEVEWFGRFELLHEYIETKKRELEQHNQELGVSGQWIANARRLTNIGTLRAYIANYLRRHPKVRQDMTVLVRQLEPTPQGLPVEIYVFSADIAWANYESIQADIFDHVLAMVPEFGLHVYQEPSGKDIRALLIPAPAVGTLRSGPGAGIVDLGATG